MADRRTRGHPQRVDVYFADKRLWGFRMGPLFSARGSRLLEVVKPEIQLARRAFEQRGYTLVHQDEAKVPVGWSYTPTIRLTFVSNK